MRRPLQKSVDGNALRTQRTRDRVLAESLRLFNAHGEARVTTARIATSLEMSAGNLYYHFRNKDQIVEELFARFEQRIGLEPRATSHGAEAIEDLWLYLHLMLESIRDYRFLYRDLDDLLSRSAKLSRHFGRIVERKLEVVESLCEGLVRTGTMRARPDEIRAVAANVLLVATYWLSFQGLRRAAGQRDAQGDLGRGAYQVMSLIAPYLVGEARSHLERLGASYID
jgi:AcrR family transcriptional regulator